MAFGGLMTLRELIDRYRDNRTAYRRNTYNETSTRREFIDPLLELLGWDVANQQGFAEAYRNVLQEDRLHVEGQSKAPDYAFRIAGTKKFFLEAKRPGVSIDSDRAPAYQIRRYGWSAKLPLSILTNVEHFAIYDCRVKPRPGDSPRVARKTIIPWDELVDRWSEVESIFSLTAIQKGAFDRYALANKAKGSIEVDDDFLNEIESWRDTLARSLHRANKRLDVHDLNDATQKLIDRIIFLRIAEDRNIETFGRLAAISKGSDVYKRLFSYFQEADKRYNSGIFHFNAKEGSPETVDKLAASLTVSDAALREVITNLYQPKSPYEFSVLSADILGQVYERFLGRTITLQGTKLAIEDKPNVKKAGGVFYTPEYITKLIVRECLKPHFESRSVKQFRGQGKNGKPVRVLDPACGSGSFLIEVYQQILDWHLQHYAASPEKFGRGPEAKMHKGPRGDWALSIAEKKRLLTTHIFGVDIDPQAVEVTKLSLLLKTMEGETEDQVASQIDFLKSERVLPDLGSNIRCGNSLIDGGIFGLFDTEDVSEDDEYKINAFDWPKEFNFFAKDKFDVVVGNPPYGASLLALEKDWFQSAYSWQSYQPDTYLLFLERAVRDLLSSGGRIGVIIPNPWLTNIRQTSLRTELFGALAFESIVHFHFNIFRKSKATVDTEVIIGAKGDPFAAKPSAYFVNGLSPAGQIDLATVRSVAHSQREWAGMASESVNIFASQTQRRVAAKMRRSGAALGTILSSSVGMKPYQVGKGTPKQTRQQVTNRSFDANTKVSATYRQYIRGADITHYVVEPKEKRFIKFGKWLAEPRPSAGFDVSPKIVMRQTGDRLVAAMDEQMLVCMNNMHVLTPSHSSIDLWAVLGLLNSEVLNWYYQFLNPEMGEALAEVKKTNIDRLPIPRMDATEQSEIANLTKRIYASLKTVGTLSGQKLIREQRKLGTDRDTLEAAVAAAYGLTDSDRKVIEKGWSV